VNSQLEMRNIMGHWRKDKSYCEMANYLSELCSSVYA
jgi:hypothetical protein